MNDYPDGCCTKSPTPQTKIESALVSQEKALLSLQESLLSLVTRLEPACRPTVGEEGFNKEDEPMSPLRRNLENNTDHIYRLKKVIEDCLVGLEL